MKKSKLLIVEDNEDDRIILKRLLIKAGYENILVATNAEEGLMLAKWEKPDLVFMDIGLPGLDGIRTCDLLKVRDKIPAVVMVTGYDDAGTKDFSAKHGADEYLVKPVKIKELTKKIEKLLKNKVIPKNHSK